MIYFTAYYWLTIVRKNRHAHVYYLTIGNVDTDIFINEIKDLLNTINFIF